MIFSTLNNRTFDKFNICLVELVLKMKKKIKFDNVGHEILKKISMKNLFSKYSLFIFLIYSVKYNELFKFKDIYQKTMRKRKNH